MLLLSVLKYLGYISNASKCYAAPEKGLPNTAYGVYLCFWSMQGDLLKDFKVETMRQGCEFH